MTDAEATADRAHGRLELLAEQLDALVGELRAEVKKLAGAPVASGCDTGGGGNDREHDDDTDQIG